MIQYKIGSSTVASANLDASDCHAPAKAAYQRLWDGAATVEDARVLRDWIAGCSILDQRSPDTDEWARSAKSAALRTVAKLDRLIARALLEKVS